VHAAASAVAVFRKLCVVLLFHDPAGPRSSAIATATSSSSARTASATPSASLHLVLLHPSPNVASPSTCQQASVIVSVRCVLMGKSLAFDYLKKLTVSLHQQQSRTQLVRSVLTTNIE
jgi:hypothetical protein